MLGVQVELQQRDEQLTAMRHAARAGGGASGANGAAGGAAAEARGVAALAEVEHSVAAIEYEMRRRGLCRAQPAGDGGGGGVGRGSGGAAFAAAAGAAAAGAATAASPGRARLSSTDGKDGKDKKAAGWMADMWQRGTSVLQQAPTKHQAPSRFLARRLCHPAFAAPTLALDPRHNPRARPHLCPRPSRLRAI